MDNKWMMDLYHGIVKAPNVASLIGLEKEFEHVTHPYKYYLLGIGFLNRNEDGLGFKNFLIATEIGIINKDIYLNSTFSDSIGSSLYYMLIDYPTVTFRAGLKFNMLAISYVFLSSSIELSKIVEFESLMHRATLLRNSGNDSRAFVGNYLAQSSFPEVLIFSDYWYAYLGFKSLGMHDKAENCLKHATAIREWLEDLPVGNKDADDYSVSDLAFLGKQRHEILYSNSKQSFLSNKFTIDFEEIKSSFFNQKLSEKSQKLREGIQSKRNGNYDRALELYDQVKLIDPLDLDVYRNTAKIHAGLGNYDQLLRNVLTRQHLRELLIPESQWDLTLELYNWDNPHKLPLTYDFEKLSRLIKHGMQNEGIKLDYSVADYDLTAAIGRAFLLRSDKEDIRNELGVSQEKLSNRLKFFLGGPSEVVFPAADSDNDLCFALLGLNVIYVNFSIIRGRLSSAQSIDPIVASSIYFEPTSAMVWQTIL